MKQDDDGFWLAVVSGCAAEKLGQPDGTGR